jgi:hypothetical protein
MERRPAHLHIRPAWNHDAAPEARRTGQAAVKFGDDVDYCESQLSRQRLRPHAKIPAPTSKRLSRLKTVRSAFHQLHRTE